MDVISKIGKRLASLIPEKEEAAKAASPSEVTEIVEEPQSSKPQKQLEDLIAEKKEADYAIVTDTSANLPLSSLGGAADPFTDPTSNGIFVIPFIYSNGTVEETCTDIDAFDGKGFYDKMREGTRYYTSQVTPQTYCDFFRPLLEAGRDVLFVGMSSGISGSFDSARTAAEMLKEDFPDRKIELVDTRGASLGEGLVTLKAQILRKVGTMISDAAKALNTMSDHMCQIFTVDNLVYLKRTGRISNLAATVGMVLHIKPLLKGDKDGHIVCCGKVRGRKKAIEAMAESFAKWTKGKIPSMIGIAEADCMDDANYLISLLKKISDKMEIMLVCYEPVTGSHVGPGALALFFEGDTAFRLEA
ncbi:MAG: DegV family protein [Firmicutes bacterium]|nr:DegV family protein [Bacillota bacterium]